jgi:transforming growth factor-beta-induced protein
LKRKIVALSSILLLLWGIYLPLIRAQTLDIVETAEADGNFTTLISALEATGLNSTLKGSGPFTVFAPTDDAFAALDTDVLNWLLANPTALTEVLLYHVVSGAYNSTDVVALSSIQTLQGDNLTITVGTTVMIDGANITAVDIECTNGIIHVIDAVMIPSGALDIIRTATNAGSFTTLLTALDVAGLTSALEAPGPFTVFAPTDDAFAALDTDVLNWLLANPTALTEVLLYHVVSGAYNSTDVVALSSIQTLQGGNLTISVGSVMVNGANITAADIETTNGMIHVIDAVLIPEACYTVPDSGVASTTVIGIGFNAGALVTVTWDGIVVPTVPAIVVVDSNGIFTAIVSVPTQTDPQVHTITTTDDEGASASTTFTVIDMTGPAGADGADGADGATGPAGPAGADGADAPTEYLWASLILALVAIIIAAYGILRKVA